MSREKADALRRLPAGPSILLFPNAWDVASARIVEQAGFPAVATSSAGVANVLGYPDGERISRAEMLDMVRRIAASVAVPVTADMEAGYGVTAEAAAETARGVIAAGAVGMNLEDAKPEGNLLPMEAQAERIRAARAAAPDLVINGRTDAFPKAGIDEAIRRANAYLAAGADGAFAKEPSRLSRSALGSVRVRKRRSGRRGRRSQARRNGGRSGPWTSRRSGSARWDRSGPRLRSSRRESGRNPSATPTTERRRRRRPRRRSRGSPSPTS